MILPILKKAFSTIFHNHRLHGKWIHTVTSVFKKQHSRLQVPENERAGAILKETGCVNLRNSFSSKKTFLSQYFMRGLGFFCTRANIIVEKENGAQLDQITGEIMQVNVHLGLQS